MPGLSTAATNPLLPPALLHSDDAGAPATPPKYMWGSDDYFPASVFFSTFFFAAFLVGVPLAAAGAGASGMSAGMALPEMGGVVLATCGYIWMWYNILGTQVCAAWCVGCMWMR